MSSTACRLVNALCRQPGGAICRWHDRLALPKHGRRWHQQVSTRSTQTHARRQSLPGLTGISCALSLCLLHMSRTCCARSLSCAWRLPAASRPGASGAMWLTRTHARARPDILSGRRRRNGSAPSKNAHVQSGTGYDARRGGSPIVCARATAVRLQLLFGFIYMFPKYTLRFLFWRTVVRDMTTDGCLMQTQQEANAAAITITTSPSPLPSATAVSACEVDVRHHCEPRCLSPAQSSSGRVCGCGKGMINSGASVAAAVPGEFTCAALVDLREVRNPEKPAKRRAIALKYGLHPDSFERSFHRRRAHWRLLP